MKTDVQIKRDIVAELQWNASINATHRGVTVQDGVARRMCIGAHWCTFALRAAVRAPWERPGGAHWSLCAMVLALGLCGLPALAQQRPEHRPRESPGSGEPVRRDQPARQERPDRQARPDQPARPRPSARPAEPGRVHAPARPGVAGPVAQLRLDQRYRHNHYYPPRGHVVPALPVGSVSITFGASNLFFHGGVWFRPTASRFVVIAPPLGVIVPLLPSAVVSLWIGGVPYYYANGVYYATSPGQGYVVVAPPPGSEDARPSSELPAPVVPPEPVIYPRAGQTPEQTEADRRECNRWATTQANAMADASVFQRAVAACMEGRGYTVR